MPWVLRGLREGIVTTPYPRRPDGYGPGFRASVSVRAPLHGGEAGEVAARCPTGAIVAEGDEVRLDRGRCVLCGRCVDERPDLFFFDESHEVAGLGRSSLFVPAGEGSGEELALLRSELGRRVRALRQSVHIRHVDAGSDGSEEWEVLALLNPVYDVQRLGIYFTASPRHADLLLVTGAGSIGMEGSLRATYEAMPDPKAVLAAGADAASGGFFSESYATRGGVGTMVPVDVFVPGSPPSPFSLLHGILLAVGRLGEGMGEGETR